MRVDYVHQISQQLLVLRLRPPMQNKEWFCISALRFPIHCAWLFFFKMIKAEVSCFGAGTVVAILISQKMRQNTSAYKLQPATSLLSEKTMTFPLIFTLACHIPCKQLQALPWTFYTLSLATNSQCQQRKNWPQRAIMPPNHSQVWLLLLFYLSQTHLAPEWYFRLFRCLVKGFLYFKLITLFLLVVGSFT